MRRYGGVAVATVLALAACTGGSSDPPAEAATTSPPAAVAAELAPDVRADVSGRLLSRPEWPDAVSVGAAQVYAPAEAAALDPDPDAEGRRLTQLGLVVAAVVQLRLPGAQDAVASVFRFAAPSGAQAMAARMAGTKGTTPFAVSGVPSAVGYHVVNRAGTVLAANITFTIGPYVYTVGGAPAGPHPLTESRLRQAAATWYARVARL